MFVEYSPRSVSAWTRCSQRPNFIHALGCAPPIRHLFEGRPLNVFHCPSRESHRYLATGSGTVFYIAIGSGLNLVGIGFAFPVRGKHSLPVSIFPSNVSSASTRVRAIISQIG